MAKPKKREWCVWAMTPSLRVWHIQDRGLSKAEAIHIVEESQLERRYDQRFKFKVLPAGQRPRRQK